MFNNSIIRKYILQSAIFPAIIFNLSAGSISNYSTNIFILKIISSLILISMLFLDIRINNPDFTSKLKEHNPKKIIYILTGFILYLSLTLFYSPAPGYGLQKIINFFTSSIPSILAFYYIILTITPERVKVFIYSIVIITIGSIS